MMTILMMIVTVIVDDGIIIVVVMIMIVPHVVVAGRALSPISLPVVGFQLLIHVNGSPANA